MLAVYEWITMTSLMVHCCTHRIMLIGQLTHSLHILKVYSVRAIVHSRFARGRGTLLVLVLELVLLVLVLLVFVLVLVILVLIL